jgi:Mn2+/Fe2+ NRAMP family transporter
MHFLFLAAVLNGLIAPLLIVIVWWLARDRSTMGPWASGSVSQVLLGGTVMVMVAAPVLWWLVPA